MWQFQVTGEPVPKARARVYRGRAVTPARTKNYERSVAVEALAAGVPRFDKQEPLCVHICAVWSRPQRLQRLKEPDDRIPKATRPDGDNVAKAVLDGLQRHFDDGQVVRLTVEKFYASRHEEPSISCTIELA